MPKTAPFMKLFYFFWLIAVFSCSTSESKSRKGQAISNTPVTKQITSLTPPQDIKAPKDTLFQSDHFLFLGDHKIFTENVATTIGNKVQATANAIALFCNKKLVGNKLSYFLYPTSEEKGLLINNTDHANIFFDKKEVHVVVNDTYAELFPQKENELIIRQLLGQPKYAFMEHGLSLYFSDRWQKNGYAYWAQLLFQSNNALLLKDLFDPELYTKESPFVKGAIAGSFVAFLIETWGKEKFLRKYTSFTPDQKTIDDLQQAWNNHMAKKKKVDLPAKPKSNDYWQGFNFAHEGYQIYNGYNSRAATRSLQRLASFNTTAIAVVPYSYMDDPHRPNFFPVMRHPGAETDESVIHVVHSARQLGMQSLLKPQVWLDHGSWSGFVEMQKEEDWELFFDFYYRWIRHYALLAQIHGVEALSVGVEFGKATLGHEEEWKNIFQKLRGIYNGQLTYCANWGEEFEKLSFWNELDFIGLNCYYPLSPHQEANRSELRAGFQENLTKVEQIAARFNKPIIFTEIGFRPVDYTWKNPHEDHLGRPFNEEAQRQCYEIVFEEIANQSWCQGILWWKWPCHELRSTQVKKGFSPMDRLAEQTVKYWFQKK